MYRTEKTILFLESASISRYLYKGLYGAGKLAVKTFKERWMPGFLPSLEKIRWIYRPRKKKRHSWFPPSFTKYEMHHLSSDWIMASNRL